MLCAASPGDNSQIVEASRGPDGGRLIVVRLRTYGVWWSQPMAPSYLRGAGWPADAVHLHHPHPLADLATLLSVEAPVIVTHHSDVRRQLVIKPLYWPLVRAVLRRASAIVVPTDAHVTVSEELNGFEDKVRIIPFGVDHTRFLPAAHVARPPGFPEPGADPVGLFVGRFVSYKGLDVLLKALVGTRLNVVLVGDGPLRPQVERQITELGLGKQVFLAGEVSDENLPWYYQASDYFVLPSTTPAEMFGVAIAEAMACGKPVITTVLPTGVREVNKAGETGLEVPPGDAEALREAMRSMAGDPELRERFGSAGRRRVEEKFTLERMVSAHLELYREVVER